MISGTLKSKGIKNYAETKKLSALNVAKIIGTYPELKTAIEETKRLSSNSLRDIQNLASDLANLGRSLGEKTVGRKISTFRRIGAIGTSKTGKGGNVKISFDEAKYNGVAVFVRDKAHESPKTFMKLLKNAADVFIEKFKNKYMNGKGKDSVNYVTGRLYRSLKRGEPKRTNENEQYSEYYIPVYFNKEIAKGSINQVGTYGKKVTVRPKNGKFLAIPVSASAQKKFKLEEGESLSKYRSVLKMASYMENGHKVPYLVSGGKKMFRLTKKPVTRTIVVDLKKGEQEILGKITKEIFKDISLFSLEKFGVSTKNIITRSGEQKQSFGVSGKFFISDTFTKKDILALNYVSIAKTAVKESKYGVFDKAVLSSRMKSGKFVPRKKRNLKITLKKLNEYGNKPETRVEKKFKSAGEYHKARAIANQRKGKIAYKNLSKEDKVRAERKTGVLFLKHALTLSNSSTTEQLVERYAKGKFKKKPEFSKITAGKLSFVDISTKRGSKILKEAEILSGKTFKEWKAEKVILSTGQKSTRGEAMKIAIGRKVIKTGTTSTEAYKEQKQKNIKSKKIEDKKDTILYYAEKETKRVGDLTIKRKEKIQNKKDELIKELNQMTTAQVRYYMDFQPIGKRKFIKKYLKERIQKQ